LSLTIVSDTSPAPESPQKPAPQIILGVTGSIAAYRSADLASQLTKRGCDVHVVMTADASEFITPLTLQVLSRHPVTTSLYDEKQSWHPGHIGLADLADLFLVAPATANTVAKLALGLADDALSALALATRAPILIAPAMNGKMWTHPATEQHVATLRSRGVEFIGPEAGILACGYEGIGRLWPVEGIVERALEILRRGKS
jgi:phosphopantothenoylcysteine decarboxylase